MRASWSCEASKIVARARNIRSAFGSDRVKELSAASREAVERCSWPGTRAEKELVLPDSDMVEGESGARGTASSASDGGSPSSDIGFEFLSGFMVTAGRGRLDMPVCHDLQ